MPALNFHARFAPLVESGLKRQTIRAMRKRPIKLYDHLYLYTGMRTKSCRMIGTARAAIVVQIEIRNDGIKYEDHVTGPGPEAVALADGFSCFTEMARWFEDTHGLPFHGQLIRW